MHDPTMGQPGEAEPGGAASTSVWGEQLSDPVSVVRLTGAGVRGRSRALRKPEEQPGRVTGQTARDRRCLVHVLSSPVV